jgi:hypothetical protein
MEICHWLLAFTGIHGLCSALANLIETVGTGAFTDPWNGVERIAGMTSAHDGERAETGLERL